MMYKIGKKFLRNLFQEKHNAISGSLCRRVEDFEKAGAISKKDCELLKGELKNVVWESYRDLENNVKFWNEGRVYKKFPVYNPQKVTEKKV